MTAAGEQLEEAVTAPHAMARQNSNRVANARCQGTTLVVPQLPQKENGL